MTALGIVGGKAECWHLMSTCQRPEFSLRTQAMGTLGEMLGCTLGDVRLHSLKSIPRMWVVEDQATLLTLPG